MKLPAVHTALARIPRPARRLLAWAGAGAALAAVFAAYLRPAMVAGVLNQLWSCF